MIIDDGAACDAIGLKGLHQVFVHVLDVGWYNIIDMLVFTHTVAFRCTIIAFEHLCIDIVQCAIIAEKACHVLLGVAPHHFDEMRGKRVQWCEVITVNRLV